MVHLTRVLPLLLSLSFLASGAVEPTDTAANPAELPPLSADDATLVEEVRQRFVAGGLEPPADVRISFHGDAADCGGNLGRYGTDEVGQWVRVCWTHDDPFVERVLQEQALVHELAHAWAEANLDDASKATFVELTGAHSWNDRSHAWEHRATEVAAELITWAILDPTVPFLGADTLACEQWAEAYEALTERSTDSTTEACH